MLGDKKKALGVILTSLGGKKAKEEEPSEGESEEEETTDEGIKAVADDILTAISAKDSDMLSQALRDFIAMC